MADPFVAEIRIFGFKFAPRGWAFCNGQIMNISQNTALFSLLGTTYGGNGQSTFALPNMQGNAPMHPNDSPPLSNHDLGEQAGSDTVTLLLSEIPFHPHACMAGGDPSNAQIPDPTESLSRSAGGSAYSSVTTGLVQMAGQILSPTGSSFPHNNMMPYLVLNFCIALQGVFPPRG